MEGREVIVGAHSILYSRDSEADRAFLRDVLGMPHVDVGEGWLIFGLPPAEVAVHPSEENDVHEFYLMCDDVDAFVSEMKARGVECGAVQSMGWGRLTQVALPGGGRLGVYQPRHARPAPMRPAGRASKPRKPRKARKAQKAAPRAGTKKATSRRPASRAKKAGRRRS